MQTLLQIDEIATRGRRIGLAPKQLAERAGVNFATFYRSLKRPTATSVGNLQALSEAIVSAEIEIRDYLLGLHPIARREGPPAA
jgi:hypothetical protein